jgi:hypothetical protein
VPVERLRLVLVGLLVVTTPVVALVAAYAAVATTQAVAVDRLTAVEVAELYLLELVVFAAFAFLLYRITLAGVSRVVADADAGEGNDVDGGARDGPGRPADRDPSNRQ